MAEVAQLATRCDYDCGTLDAAMTGELEHRLSLDDGIRDISRVVLDDDRMIAAGWARMMGGPLGFRACLYAFAEPGHSVGPELSRWLDSHCTAHVQEARFERVLSASTDSLPQDDVALYESLGYDRLYVELEMSRGVVQTAPPTQSDSVEVAPWVASRHEEIRQAYNESFSERGFAGYEPETWNRAFMPGEDFRESLSFVALDHDVVVGFIFGNVPSESDGWIHPDLVDRGWLDFLGVRPSHQRQAIGSALISAACEAMHASGSNTVGLRVNEENSAAINLYRQLGFLTARKHVVYHRLI